MGLIVYHVISPLSARIEFLSCSGVRCCKVVEISMFIESDIVEVPSGVLNVLGFGGILTTRAPTQRGSYPLCNYVESSACIAMRRVRGTGMECGMIESAVEMEIFDISYLIHCFSI